MFIPHFLPNYVRFFRRSYIHTSLPVPSFVISHYLSETGSSFCF
ncbi:hypothetical protein HMPREF0322_04327 [Desulfitobacterium hafniense DP7]|uniref:Uncharacterized protein n=1 Tax=Desulfitobacterium hafniense DP7 TaxID=537010 RepID=G9XTM0_DESHA|nr:hypothetical protein HMPREF0322_04327 [Desulfitobacterium hafniense DP7]